MNEGNNSVARQYECATSNFQARCDVFVRWRIRRGDFLGCDPIWTIGHNRN